MSGGEELQGDMEVFSDEGSKAILRALPNIPWNPDLTTTFPEWETEIRARLTDRRTGAEYYVSSDSRYLEAEHQDAQEVAELSHGVGDQSVTPLIMIQKIHPARLFPAYKMPFALYPHNYYREGPRVMVLYGPTLTSGSELGNEKRHEFEDLIRELVL